MIPSVRSGVTIETVRASSIGRASPCRPPAARSLVCLCFAAVFVPARSLRRFVCGGVPPLCPSRACGVAASLRFASLARLSYSYPCSFVSVLGAAGRAACAAETGLSAGYIAGYALVYIRVSIYFALIFFACFLLVAIDFYDFDPYIVNAARSEHPSDGRCH